LHSGILYLMADWRTNDILKSASRYQEVFMKTLAIGLFFFLACDITGSKDDTTYECDGRVYCSEMTSCEEAVWFLEHCPDMKMDGDSDGVPCESQWCR
jgi:hypothetical protein